MNPYVLLALAISTSYAAHDMPPTYRKVCAAVWMVITFVFMFTT
jgi:hypothetical protein